jgi:hypothetical protein
MKRLALICAIFAAVLLPAAALLSSSPGAASTLQQEATPVPNLSIGDDTCLTCHGQQGLALKLNDGTSLDLYVDPAEHAGSIHGRRGYACVQCHTDVGAYPHPPFAAANRRDVTLLLNDVCKRCHLSQYELTQDSVHAHARSSGYTDAAVCTDCHSAHAVQEWVDQQTGETLPEARTAIPQTCAKCHSAIYEEYLTSVHGSALTNENNPDVPTCVDCHGVHSIEDPTTARFRLASPQICAKCHTDPARMSKYGISTDVLNTYVADFHGTTVAIFEKQSPDAETNKPVCYDCHGVHNIARVDDPHKGLEVKENLLATCQKCHPTADVNFPTAWLSHYIPSPDKYPLVFYVNLFYKFLIPTVVGGMALLVFMDASRKTINLRKKRRIEKQQKASPPPQPGEKTSLEASGLMSAEVHQEGQGDEFDPNGLSPAGYRSEAEAEHGSTE